MIAAATQRVESAGLSLWDRLIVESAISCGAMCLWTEDLYAGQTIGDLTIANPFATAAG